MPCSAKLDKNIGMPYIDCMGIKRTRHAVYDIKYHFVWIPKYRKQFLIDDMKTRLKQIFGEIAEQYEMEIDTMDVMPDHIHLFLAAPPRYSPSKIVNIFKGISSRKMFIEFPHLKRYLWGGELWNDGYFVRTTGDKVTSEIIRRYIEYQKHQAEQLELF